MQVVVKLGKHWADAYTTSAATTSTSEVSADLTRSVGNKLAQGFGGTDPETGLFTYCFSDLWLSMTVDSA